MEEEDEKEGRRPQSLSGAILQYFFIGIKKTWPPDSLYCTSLLEGFHDGVLTSMWDSQLFIYFYFSFGVGNRKSDKKLVADDDLWRMKFKD